MTIRIEVTGDSLPEVADKLLALAGQFGAVRSCGYDHTPNAETAAAMRELEDARAEKPKTTRKTKKAEPETEQEDAGNPSASADTEASSSPASSQDSGDEKSDSGQTAPADASPSELDFDKEVAPVVIDAVQRLGKPAVSALLSEFGVERASEVDPSLYGELVERLKAL